MSDRPPLPPLRSVGTFAADRLSAERGDRLLFCGLTFSLPPGSALVLSGPNGSGKSSLLRLMAGFGRPYAGCFTWNKSPIAEDMEAHRARLHYVGHQEALKPSLSVLETIRFWADLRRTEQLDPIAALSPLGLAHLGDTPCRFLSSGQRRRLALSRVLVADAPLWFLDEPTVGLDVAALDALSGLIAHHRARGGSVVLSTHQGMALTGALTLSITDFPPPSALVSAEQVNDVMERW